MYPAFMSHIAAMNRTYKLPQVGDDDIQHRVAQFKDILGKEFAELGDIEIDLQQAASTADYLRARVGMADLCGDIIVYCASEMVRWGIPADQVMAIIMSSNFSKLGADGEPIINPENGKFEKGPNYWKPEPLIHAVLAGNLRLDIQEFSRCTIPTGIILQQKQQEGSQQPLQEPATPSHQPDSGSQEEAHRP